MSRVWRTHAPRNRRWGSLGRSSICSTHISSHPIPSSTTPCQPKCKRGVLVHIRQQIQLAKRLQKRADARTLVWRNRRPACFPRCSIWTGARIILPAQITVLREASIAEVGPQAMQCPCIQREDLTLGFKACVSVPELRGENEPAEGFSAAGVCNIGEGVGRAGEERCFLQLLSKVAFGGVEGTMGNKRS